MTLPGFTAETCIEAPGKHYRMTGEPTQLGATVVRAQFHIPICLSRCVDGGGDPAWCFCMCHGGGIHKCGLPM
jgi:hypothetical protein